MWESKLGKDGFYVYQGEAGPPYRPGFQNFSLNGLRLLLDVLGDALEEAGFDNGSVIFDMNVAREIDLYFPTGNTLLLNKLHVRGEVLWFKKHNAKRGEYVKIPLADPTLNEQLVAILKDRGQKIASRSKFVAQAGLPTGGTK
jgi:hypothetical protein